MIRKPIDVLQQFPVRKSKRQKAAFRDAVAAYARERGYAVQVEKGSFGAQNVVIGDPVKADYLVTAHYDTPASIGLPNFITPCNLTVYLLWQMVIVAVFVAAALAVRLILEFATGNEEAAKLGMMAVYWVLLLLMLFGPANRNNANDNTSGVVTVLEILTSLQENQRDKVCFVLFDLEEMGLLGSASYRKAHRRETDRQLILNLDCVGDGDAIMLFPTKKLKQDPEKLGRLEMICRPCGKKSIRLHRKGVAICPSDHGNFPYAAGVMAFQKKRFLGLYCGRIHTNRDRVLEMTNVNILRSAIISLISQ